ncbi:2-hydroxyacid dehydrogenase-related [Holotrichia oblita]|uniref:2-hydroxyacid dehydrogenase-related n=1 Tax=Holotrichia oblita TaxID=644536 RepID=A0ACB9TGK2_HOLOL|nr:2-hydroxyacid dehydrogenase-related [Holotrichia oblita]
MGSVSVFTKIPNLLKELRSCLPAVQFHEITSGTYFHLLHVIYLHNVILIGYVQVSPNLCIQILDKDDKLKSSEIIVADFNLLAPVLYNLPKTKWVQGTWAGVDKLMPYIQQDNLPAFTITRYSGKHFGRIMAEYVLSHIVNHERDYLNVYKNQIAKCWKQDGKISDYRVISDLNIDRATVFINVGRGSIISDGDLIEALDKKWLSAAILDVFNEEPLPESSLLWSMPQVKITPHVSAVSIARHIAEQFMDNYKLHMSNEPIPTTLDLSKGY